MTVLITGAAGTIGTMLRRHLPALGWDLRGFDRVELPDDDPIPMTLGEVTDPGALDDACAGVEAVVHLAGEPAEGPWEVIRDSNIEGTYQLFEAARRAGVPRVVYASSNHAAGYTHRPDDGVLPADTALRPDTLYGVSKAFGEALGRYYFDRYGLRVACLRIGHCDWQPYPDLPAHEQWLSPADAARLVDACLRSQNLTYALVWGISANTGRWLSLTEGERLGYHAEDDAGDAPPPKVPHPRDELVGRFFTTAEYDIDVIRAQA